MDPRLFSSLEFRCIGPHRGGRCVAVAGHPTDVGTFYFGGCAGGVWKTTNAGSHWWNVSDGFFKTAAVGALAVSDSDPNVLYAGTGEACIRSNVSHGDGVYRSDDNGRTWRNVGLAATRHISTLAIHPHNPDVVYVAALGHAWGPNHERGVYRSTNGGKDWDLVLHKSDKAGAASLSMDLRNPRVLYAAVWQGRRYPHAAESGGEDSGIWRSLDAGETWTEVTHNKGLPKGLLGRIGVAASPAQAGRVWALVESEDGALFRSDDYGETWQRLCDKSELRRRPWYYMHVFADPSDANTVWVLNLNAWRSLDGGATFEDIPTPHGDNHGLWIDPRNSQRMIEGNDGGACITLDGARSWSTLLNQPTAQFYHVTTDNQVPYHVYGPQQDNWAMRLPSIDFEGAISWKDYVEPGGGESGYLAIDQNPPNQVFGGGIGTGAGHGRLIAWNPATGQKRNVTVWPEVHGMGAGAESLKYRFQWTFPVEFSPHDGALYICSNFVHRSTDGGSSWETISPDVTRNDPSKLGPSGGPITADNSGAEIYCTIFAFRESPHEQGVLWAGSDDGLIHLSRDGGRNWTNVTPPDLPEWALIGIIEPSPHDAATVYVSATCYKSDDTRPFLYRTANYGETWTRITSGIPEDEFTRVIREDPARRGLLYCGTERGIHVSFDDGVNWHRLETNLPITPIWDLVVKGTDLVVASHGRSLWILDDITPLHQIYDGVANEPAHLFKPRETTRFRIGGRAFDRKVGPNINYKMTGPLTVAYKPTEAASGAKTEQLYDAGQNPPVGVIVHYWLKEAPADGVTLTFLDGEGKEIRSFSTRKEKKSPGAEAPAASSASGSGSGSGSGLASTSPSGSAPAPSGSASASASPSSGAAPAAAGAAAPAPSGSGTDVSAAASPAAEAAGEQQQKSAEEEVAIDEEAEPEQGLSAPAAAASNRFVWAYGYPPPPKLDNRKAKKNDEMDEGLAPRAIPGQYAVRLRVGEQEFTESFTIAPDPRLPVSQDDLKAQFELKLAIRDRLAEAYDALNQIQRVRDQVEAWEKRLKDRADAASARDLGKRLREQLDAVERELMNVDIDKPRPGPTRIKEKLETLSSMIDESDHAPTRGAHDVYEMLVGKLTEQQRALSEVLDQPLRSFNESLTALEIPLVGP